MKTLTIEAAFPEGDPLRKSVDDVARQTFRLLAVATDPELANIATMEIRCPADSAPKS